MDAVVVAAEIQSLILSDLPSFKHRHPRTEVDNLRSGAGGKFLHPVQPLRLTPFRSVLLERQQFAPVTCGANK